MLHPPHSSLIKSAASKTRSVLVSSPALAAVAVAPRGSRVHEKAELEGGGKWEIGTILVRHLHEIADNPRCIVT
jgi:hypothetical protein